MATIDSQDLRERYMCFRVLILGRANAGKTTILQKVCNTMEHPEIYDTKGNKVRVRIYIMHRISFINYAQHGNHDIENEMVFKSNPGFIFHDSCGFEVGSEEEFENMKKLEERIHAIW
ncbi:uncharacterized protein F5147DRAFT_584391 [Suillus discolor]|uniref:G domain-containing protein n=1 Tax=Suillus discolor TaxID=1912936 RepID=A0A9P7EYY2_9AGAM|nr:uncharacterized protein F5147DRAFT_584391 [Suillus discolor]KAG2095893.1 hypothetical protein F5147DRAFT_584391 [Suillus discolor]